MDKTQRQAAIDAVQGAAIPKGKEGITRAELDQTLKEKNLLPENAQELGPVYANANLRNEPKGSDTYVHKSFLKTKRKPQEKRKQQKQPRRGSGAPAGSQPVTIDNPNEVLVDVKGNTLPFKNVVRVVIYLAAFVIVFGLASSYGPDIANAFSQIK